MPGSIMEKFPAIWSLFMTIDAASVILLMYGLTSCKVGGVNVLKMGKSPPLFPTSAPISH